jgi:hypothetical protein
MSKIPISIAVENLSDKLINVELFKDIKNSEYNGGNYITNDYTIKASGLTYQQLIFALRCNPLHIRSINTLNFGSNSVINYTDLVIKNNVCSPNIVGYKLDKKLLEPTKENSDGIIVTTPYFEENFVLNGLTCSIEINNIKPKSILVILFNTK